MSREVATLEHELQSAPKPVARALEAAGPRRREAERTHVGDDSVEGAVCVAESVLAGGQLAEVPRRPRHDVVVELEHDASGRLLVDSDVELRGRKR